MFNSDILNQLGQVIQVSRQVARDFMARRNVVACGVGFKIKGERQTCIPSIVVSVTHKEPPQTLSPSDLIPQAIQNITTDVIETGEIEALSLDRRLAIRPARPGTSIGHFEGNTGTFGCVVQRGTQKFILGNNHVLANLNKAKLGDSILQPGISDGGIAQDAVGQLAMYVPIRFLEEPVVIDTSASAQSTERQGCSQWISRLLEVIGTLGNPGAVTQPTIPLHENRVDAALAAPLDNILLDPCIIDFGGPPLGIVGPKLGMRVVKSGRTTGITEAQIIQIDVTVNVRYGNQMARFTHQIMTTPFSELGDSGSLVLDFERKAVGLLFSGSDQITVLNPIRSVLSALDAELVTA